MLVENTKKDLISELVKIGMNINQAKVYLALLELGESSIQKLSKKCGVGRTLIYTFLDKMKSERYIAETSKGKTKVYSANNINTIIQKKEEDIKNLKNKSELFEKLKSNCINPPKVTFYEGIDGIKSVYDDILFSKKDIKSFEDIEILKKNLPENFFDYFPKERAKREIWIKSISRESLIAKEFSRNNNELMRTTKFVNVPPLNCDINIYGNKVAIFDLQKDTQMALIIENESIAKTMEIIWDQIWEK